MGDLFNLAFQYKNMFCYKKYLDPVFYSSGFTVYKINDFM